MKTNLLIAAVLMFVGCANAPSSDSIPEPQSIVQNTIVIEQVRFASVEACPSAALDVSDRICNLWGWQQYWQSLVHAPLPDELEINNTSSVSQQLQQLLTTLHPEQSIDTQQKGIDELNRIVGHLEPAMRDWFRLLMAQVQARIELSAQLATQQDTIAVHEQNLATVRAQLADAEQKLKALTEIEQQLGEAP